MLEVCTKLGALKIIFQKGCILNNQDICAPNQDIYCIYGLFLAHFPNFWSKNWGNFFQKLQVCHAQVHKGLYHHAKIQGNLMIQFQENTQTDSRMEGRTDPMSQDPYGYCCGLNRYNFSRLAFKSQRYRVRCWSNKKILYHSMQKISSIHTLILKIQQILLSCELNKRPCTFLTTPTQISLI